VRASARICWVPPGVRTVRRQVTYAGHPLYRFVNAKKAGEITCQNVSQFGAKWLVVTPAGKAVH
jgi:hypothetical protein